MKFALLKALSPSGTLSESWMETTQQSFLQNPVVFRRDYEKLVRAIADLELMEQYIRKEVLHDDESTSDARMVMDRVKDAFSYVSPYLAIIDELARIRKLP